MGACVLRVGGEKVRLNWLNVGDGLNFQKAQTVNECVLHSAHDGKILCHW